MRAYRELIQEPEMEQGVDGLLAMVTAGTNTTPAMGAGVTEDQFK